MALSSLDELDNKIIDKKILSEVFLKIYSDEPELVKLLSADVHNMSNSEFIFNLNTMHSKINSDKELLSGIKNLILSEYSIDTTILNPTNIDFEIYVADVLKYTFKDLGLIYMVESKYSTLAGLLYKFKAVFDVIRCFDPYDTNVKISEIINNTYVKNNWNFKALVQLTEDVNTTQHTWSAWSNKNQRMTALTIETPNTIININCDNTPGFKKWYNSIPDNRRVVMMGSKSKPVYMNKVLLHDKLEENDQIRWLKIGYK